MSERSDPADETRDRRRPWSTSWRSALRLAWRDAVGHKGSTLLIMAMIGLPVLIIGAGVAGLATVEVTPKESLPASVGRAQALLTTNDGAVTQAVNGQVITETGLPAVAATGHPAGEPWTSSQLARLTGGQVGVSDTAEVLARWSTGSQGVTARVLGREVLAGSGLVVLVEGRLPDGPGQVLVTESGVAAGLPRSGRIQLATGQQQAAAEIVGVVRATGPSFEPVALVVGQEWLDPAQLSDYLVVRDQPVTWDVVVAWNAAGVSVLSPTVVADPPAGVPATATPRSGANAAIVVALSLGLVLETALLAGPAFAISAAGRRRSLALIASNGADHDQIARHVMAQGVVLGGVAVLLGAGLGTAVGWLGVRGVAGLFDPSRSSSIGSPPWDTYGWMLAMIMVVAFAAAAVSALVPGLKVAGLDVGAALAGRGERQPIRRSFPLAAAVIMGVGAVLLGLSLAAGSSFAALTGIATGGGVMIIGALFAIPVIIERVGRWGSGAPLAVRMGVRDASRSRARTAPAVAAITVVVAVLTMISISSLSDDAQSRRDYLPATLPGAAVVDAYGPVLATLAVVRAEHPTWTVAPSGWSWTDSDDGRSREVSAVPAGCAPAQTIAPWDPAARPGRCQLSSADNGWRITVAAPNTVNPAAELSTSQRTALDRGSVLVSNPELIDRGRVRLAYQERGPDPTAAPTLLRAVEVPAVLVTPTQLGALAFADGRTEQTDGAVITATGADAIAMPWTTQRYEIVDPAGPISVADEQALDDRVAVPLRVERGYESDTSVISVVLLGIAVALVLAGSLISTALTQVEARGASTTLAAVGASRSLRRGAAAAQAIMIALLGVLLGMALGVVPGLGLAASLTTDHDPEGLAPMFVIPYARFAVLIFAIPLLAALLAVIMVGRDPVLTRRPT